MEPGEQKSTVHNKRHSVSAQSIYLSIHPSMHSVIHSVINGMGEESLPYLARAFRCI